MQECATIWLQMKLTIAEYSLTTSASVDYKIQKERTLHLVLRLRGETERDTNDNVTIKVLRLRGETEHDTNDNVTTKTQSTFHTAHMNINT